MQPCLMPCMGAPRQTRAQLKLVPETLHGYVYSIGSLLCALLLGVVIYGPAVWAR